MEVGTKEGKVLVPKKGAKKMIASLVAMVLGVAGVAYVANSFPAHPDAAASNGGDPKGDRRGIDDMLVVDGLDGLLGDAEDPEEQD